MITLHRLRFAFAPVLALSGLALSGLSSACSSSSSSNPASDAGTTTDVGTNPCGVAATRVVFLPAGSSEADVQKAFVGAKTGDSIVFDKGTFAFSNTLTLATDGVAVCGQGMDASVLDFTAQKTGSEGIYGDKVKNFSISKLGVKNTAGNAIKVLGGMQLAFRALKVEWTNPNPATHGAYGIYPVQSQQVLIEDSVVIGASDSGVYVGQSDTVVLRRNRAEQNVAGIEIENTYNADVYENTATGNTAGILVFDLPDLQQLGGHGIRVFNNTSKENNTKNFAPVGNIVGKVPAGTGFFVMANKDVEVFGNTFDGNQTANSAVVSFYVTSIDIKDTKYYPFPTRVTFHDNTYLNGGKKPDISHDIGLLANINMALFDGGHVPDIVYDGILDPAKPAGTNPMEVCFKNNKDATFGNFHLDKLPKDGTDLTGILTKDAANYDCAQTPLPKVVVPGLAE